MKSRAKGEAERRKSAKKQQMKQQQNSDRCTKPDHSTKDTLSSTQNEAKLQVVTRTPLQIKFRSKKNDENAATSASSAELQTHLQFLSVDRNRPNSFHQILAFPARQFTELLIPKGQIECREKSNSESLDEGGQCWCRRDASRRGMGAEARGANHPTPSL